MLSPDRVHGPPSGRSLDAAAKSDTGRVGDGTRRGDRRSAGDEETRRARQAHAHGRWDAASGLSRGGWERPRPAWDSSGPVWTGLGPFRAGLGPV